MNRGVLVALLSIALLGVPLAGAADITEPAELAIEQPTYVDGDVSVDQSGDTPLYKAQGGELLISLTNTSGTVTDFGIEEDAGTLTHDPDLGLYRFQTDADATYSLYWVVQEQRTEGNQTTTASVRYEAQLRVSKSDMTHLEAGSLEDMRTDAQSWRNWKAAVLSDKVAGDDADIEEETEAAVSLLRLRHNPLQALTGDFTALLMTLFITLSGLVIVAMAVGAHLWSRRRDIVEQRRQRQLDAERADLEDELDTMEAYERQSKLEGIDWNDIFPDHVARAFRDNLGETVLDGWLVMGPVLNPKHILRDRLAAMQDTHVAVEEPVTDGGEPEEERSYTLYPKGETPEDVSEGSLISLEDPSDDLVRGVSLRDPELRDFDPTTDLPEDLEIDRDIETLVDELDMDMRRGFDDDPEMVAKYLTDFLQTVVDHEYTDSDGEVRPIRHALNLWLRALRHIGEREGVRSAGYQAEHVEMLLETYDREEEIADWVNKVELGEVQ